MRNEVIFAGFGGQGVVKAALLLSLAAGLHEDKEVAQTQSYGPEARGGACRSEVVISDKEIDYIKTMNIDTFVVMSQPALDKYFEKLDPDKTVVIADTTAIFRIRCKKSMPSKPPGSPKKISVARFLPISSCWVQLRPSPG